jgi:hypothetical protein
MWVNEYLIGKHGTKRGTEIIDDIDRWYDQCIITLMIH